jgi:hypothetical protein
MVDYNKTKDYLQSTQSHIALYIVFFIMAMVFIAVLGEWAKWAW